MNIPKLFKHKKYLNKKPTINSLFWCSGASTIKKSALELGIISYATQPEIICSKLTIETLEQDVKYFQS